MSRWPLTVAGVSVAFLVAGPLPGAWPVYLLAGAALYCLLTP